MQFTDGTVTGNGVALAVRDFGGSGQPIVLLHGAGRMLVDSTPLAEQLTPHFRVVAMDFRNHGLSGDADWTFDDVVADVKAVADHFGFERPAVVGHSLGGIVAAIYATTYPDQTFAAVNLDGHGFGTADQYPGIEPAVYEERTAQLKAFAEEMSARPPMSTEQVNEARAAYEQQAVALSMPTELVREAFDRALSELPDGTFQIRPTAEWGGTMMAEVEALKMMDLWEHTPRPLLIYNATAPDPWVANPPPGMEWLGEFMAAYRTGLDRDLRSLAERKPSIAPITLDATHALIFERTELIGQQIAEFLSGVAGRKAMARPARP